MRPKRSLKVRVQKLRQKRRQILANMVEPNDKHMLTYQLDLVANRDRRQQVQRIDSKLQSVRTRRVLELQKNPRAKRLLNRLQQSKKKSISARVYEWFFGEP